MNGCAINLKNFLHIWMTSSVDRLHTLSFMYSWIHFGSLPRLSARANLCDKNKNIECFQINQGYEQRYGVLHDCIVLAMTSSTDAHTVLHVFLYPCGFLHLSLWNMKTQLSHINQTLLSPKLYILITRNCENQQV